MPNDLYSIEQVADLLGLHARTVRNYVRVGRLKAVRIGKQYRIGGADLEAFTGHPITAPPSVPRQRHVEASSVVQIDAISPDEASRVSNMLMAAAKGRDEGDEALRIDSIYDRERGRLKVILSGSLGTSAGLLRMISALTETGS